MASTLDLRQLVVERKAPPSERVGHRRRFLARYALPGVILLGFAAVLAWAARDSFLPARPVTVVPVIVTRAETQQAGTPLFQAAGWVEPRPSASVVSALAEGVVEQVLVIDGQKVEAGQPVAKLVEADARIAVRQAEADLRLNQAERAQAQAALKAAEAHLRQPVQLEAAMAEANAASVKTRSELNNLPFVIRAARSRLELARQDLQGKREVGDGIAGRALQRAESEYESAMAGVDELLSRQSGLEAEVKSLEQKRDVLAMQLELKTDEVRNVAEAEAVLAAAEAKVDQAELAVETAKLQLERMTVIAPVAGQVLRISARPGQRLMGLASASEVDSTTVLSLYNPQRLQVRTDVRLEDVPHVQVGGRVEIETASHGELLKGSVISVTSQADVQKNTLQVNVAIDSPPPAIRPEMLAQVTFLAVENPGAKAEGSQQTLKTMIPRELVMTGDGGSFVWLADRNQGVARKQTVKLGRATTDKLVEVIEGVTAMDKLIAGGREGLEDGTRIRVTGEDSSMGMQP